MANVFDPIINLVRDFGLGFGKLIGEQNAVYGIYLFAFFAGIFTLLNMILKNIGFFNKNGGSKAAGFVSFAIATITTGSVFYGKSVPQLINTFNDFFMFILILISLVSILIYAINYNRTHKGSKFAKFLLFASIYLTASILIQPFDSSANGLQAGFLVDKIGANSSENIVDITSILIVISQALMWVFLILMIFGLFNKNEKLKSMSEHIYGKAKGKFIEKGKIVDEINLILGQINKDVNDIDKAYQKLMEINK